MCAPIYDPRIEPVDHRSEAEASGFQTAMLTSTAAMAAILLSKIDALTVQAKAEEKKCHEEAGNHHPPPSIAQ